MTYNYTDAPVIENKEDPIIEELSGGEVTLFCIVSGHPIPTVTWLKNGKPLEREGGTNIENSLVSGFGGRTSVNSSLALSELSKEDDGYYTCRAENDLAQVDMEQGYILSVKDPIIPSNIVYSFKIVFCRFIHTLLQALWVNRTKQFDMHLILALCSVCYHF